MDKNENNRRFYDDMTAASDNTKVSSPYRIQQQIESTQRRPNINLRDTVLRLRKELEEELERERLAAREEANRRQIEREDEDRRRRNAEYYLKKEQEKQALYEKDKALREELSREEAKKKDELYESEYRAWLEDVQKNPNNYSESTQEAVKRAMHSYKHPKDYLARLDRGLARALFGLKNAAGKTALSSIDTNGTSIFGELSLTEYKQEALKYHDYSIQLQLSINDLNNQRNTLSQKYNINSTYAAMNPNDPAVKMFNLEYQELTGQINGLKAQLNDPTFKQFDDSYKQLYTVDKEGFWASIGRKYRDVISSQTYDQYKDYVAKRNRLRDVANYNKILTEQEYKDNVGIRPFLAKPLGVMGEQEIVSRRNPDSYTPEELLNLDAKYTAQRSKDLEEERKGYIKEYEENRKHLLESTKYWDVSKYYDHGVNAHQFDDLWNLGYVWYELPQMLGSTFSSPHQAVSTALSAVSFGAYASTPWTGGLGAIGGAVADLAATPFQIAGGYAENYAESGDKRIDLFTELLGGKDSDDYKRIMSEVKRRSKSYWKARGMDEKSIDKNLEGETGDRFALKDLMMGVLDHMVDKDGNAYVKDKYGNPLYTNPIADPELFKARLYSTQGLLALFDANNMRTMAGTFFEKALTLTPTTWMKKAASVAFDKATSRWIVNTAEDIAADASGRVTAKAAEKAAGKRAARETARETYSNGFRKNSFSETFAKGATRGAAIGEMSGFGFPGQIVGGLAGGTVNTAMRIGLSRLSPSARAAYRTIEEGILHKYQDIYDKIISTSEFGRAVAIFGGKVARATAASQLSEMAEEAVQYLNSKEDFASKYGWGGMSIGDMIANDIYQGARVFDSYMSLLGLSNSELLNDAEYWANAKGGFALGGLHTGIMRAVMEGASAYKEYGIHSSILTSSIMNREADAKDRASNVEFARLAMRKRTPETLSVIEWMQKNDSRRENPYFSQEDYDEKINAANTINSMVNNKRIREGLEAKGIAYGTEQYANAIADIYSINRQRQQNIAESREKENNINQLWNSKEYQDEADKIVENMFASNFEEHIGRGSAIIEAGNKAVSDEITRAKAAGEDTETSDFKKHLQNIRKEAQELAARSIDITYRQHVIGMSHTAHKLLSLIKLRAKHNTISDFFTFLRDKFNINPKRPDAKLIVKEVDNQIEQAKKDLAKFDEDFDVDMTDGAILDYIKTLPIITAHSDDIERHEIASAMLQADRAVIDKHDQMFLFGLVLNKEGKLEYNPAAYKAKQSRQKQLAEDLRSGKITVEQYTTLLQEEQELPEYNAKDVENNPYKRRIQSIIDTRNDNKALNWMINDIENGDGVVKILEEITEKEYKEDTSDDTKAKAKEESESFSFESSEVESPTVTSEPIETAKPSAKEKYEKRKAGAKKRYNERKKSLKDLRKRTYATFVPIPTPLLDIANALITKAEIATYKIAQFAEELKAIADNNGYNAKSFISGIKAFYIDKLVSVLSTNPSLAENFSSTQEIVLFDFGDIVVQQPIISGVGEDIQQMINKDAENIDSDLSTHYDIIVKRGDTVEVYPNNEAIVNARFDTNAFRKDTIDRLNSANTSDESFRQALQKEFEGFLNSNIPIEKYVKYRNVDGMVEAIANRRWNQENEQSVIFGKLMRNTVLAIMFNKEDEIDQHIVSRPDVYEQFRQLIINVYNKITSKENGMGLTVIDCNRAIYGTDHFGNKISSEADIIATDGNKLYAIDIRYSFQSLRENWNHKYEHATFTINEHVTRRLKLIELIINTKFKKGVNGLYCLGIIYNPEDNILTVDIEKGNYFIAVKSDTLDNHDNTIEGFRNSAQTLVDEINNNISEYNIYAEEVKRYVDGYEPISLIEVLTFGSVLEYADYINTLHAEYDHIIDRIDEMRTIINQNQNLYNEIWNSRTDSPLSIQQLPDIYQQYARLRNICADIDLVLDEVPSLKVTTEGEKQNIDKLIESIFEAQYILDQLMSNQETAQIDLSAEQELITVALEKMAQNKDNFGKASMFVRQWWATRLAVGVDDNNTTSVKTVSDIFFGYINKIQSWVNTLRNHVLSEIGNYYDLQEWYSAILNNYFTQLLNNAELFSNNYITDFALKVSLQLTIQNGRDLINDFNAIWDTRPENGFDGPSISPEVDKINRLPVRWMDKWSWSDSIMPAFDQMTSKPYYYLSISPTFLDSDFNLYISDNGELRLTIDGKDKNGYSKHVDIGFINDISKAKNDKDRWIYVNNARQKFIRKAIAVINFVKSHPGWEVKFDKTTDKGQILYNQDGTLHPVTKFIFADDKNKQDLYTIKLSKQNRIGMLVTLRGDQLGPDVYSVKGGNNLTEDVGGFDRDYTKLVLNTQSGAIVYFYNTGDGQYIGTPIQSTKIGEDAPKLVYLMQKYMDGDRIDQYGFDIMELLRMRLYMADPQRKLTSRNNTNNMITLKNGVVIIGNDEYDIVTKKNELIERISLMSNVTRASMMNESMRTSENSVISRARTLFGLSNTRKMQLSNGLVFDIEDFTHKNSDPNSQDGSTWLGYMLRNNLLGSSANILGYKELRISNIRALPKGFAEEKTVKKEIDLAKQKPKVVVKADLFFEKLKGLLKTISESEIDFNRGVEEQEIFINSVKEYFDKVLGINGKIEFSSTDEKFLSAVSKNVRIAGICTDEIIKLSRFVPMSVAWHEAFHKIFELVIPSNERDSFYNAYKNSIYGRFAKPTDRDIAETFADMFMTYMQNKESLNKADTFFKKAKAWIKTFAFNIGMNFKIGKKKSEEMYQLYNEINAGKYKDTKISQEQHDRFKKLFGEGLYYTVTNIDSKTSADFSNISNVGEKDKLVRSLAYYILKSYEIDGLNPNVARVRITGGTDNMKPTPDRLAEMYDGAVIEYLKSLHPVFEEVFEKVEKEYTDDKGKVVKRNYYPKFEALSRDIADYISTLFDTMRKPKVEEDDSDDTDTQSQTGEAVDFKSKDTDHWDKAAYEFSKLDGLMDEVKLFFGTIPYSKYVETKDEEGNSILSVEIDYNRNQFGTPEFMPIEEVWNLIVKKFHDVSSIEELDKRLEEYSTVKEVYAQVYTKFHSLVYGEEGKNNGIYKKNDKGDVIIAQTNFDREAKALQILSAIQSQNLNFLVALSSKQKDDDNSEGKSTRIVESSLDRDSKSYPDQWNRYLVSGLIGVFQRERGEGFELDSNGKRKKTLLLFRDGMGGKNGTDIFSRTAKFFLDLRTALLSNNSEFNIEGISYNSNNFGDVNRIKDEIVHKLCTIGIMFERDALDYMLSELYGGVNIDALTRFLMDSPASDDPQVQEDAKLQTLTSFINTLNRYVNDGGIINQELIEKEGYGKIGFVGKLAKYQGQYKRMSTLSMALALNGKKLFTISLNNTISHIIKLLNTFDLLNETINTLSNFGFNITKNEAGLPIGSIILKAILERKPLKLEGFTYIGFKTDNKGDLGSEYTEESTVEDYIAKMTMLQQGYLIFPTLADKGTWMLMSGVPIPGMKFIESTDPDTKQKSVTVTDGPTVRIINGKPYLIPNDKVLDLMIEYAKCELLGIQQCMEDLGYENIPGYEKQGRTKLTEDQKIENYHTANKSIEPNGTRFLSLTKIANYEYNKDEHKWKIVTHNLNDPREDSVTLLQRAQDVFFAQREGETILQMIDRLRESMALTLAIQTQHEVNTAVDLGIVKRISYSYKFGNTTVSISENDKSLQNLDSKDLNIAQIKALQRYIMNTTKTKNGVVWKDVLDEEQRAFYRQTARSLAIAAILQDATNRHIICSQEVQRCFSGHPAFFKVKYGKTGIIDSAYDIQKRIGGMVSTGEDNILGIPGIKSEYTCAECNDYLVGTKSNIAPRLTSLFSENQARHVFGLKTGFWEDAYNLTIDLIKEKYPNYSVLIDKLMQEGNRYAQAFTEGIDVADGSAYISADMCRDMLRMRGAYDNKVRTAFKTLMSSSKYDWIKSVEAYETIYKALNIVPTKYTAYGFRKHTSNGDLISDVAVVYYDKFALFPIFPCMATGSMNGIYNKMTDEGVDMLLMHSSVKVGSQGGVTFDGEKISEPFNKYTQSYSYLRRQLNTDPEEKDTSAIGTQMLKIGLANLVPSRHYIDEDGNTVSGRSILDQFMSSINALADIGEHELRSMFFDKVTRVTKDGRYTEERINYEKISDYLKEQLTARNANKTLIQSIQVVTDPVTGVKKLATPLAATTDAQWIESIFISTMNKKVVDINVPGNSFIQRSAFGMEGDNEMDIKLNNGNKLQMINEQGSMDVVITIDYFKDILPEGVSFELAKQYLIDQGIISGIKTGQSEWNNAETIMIGYRIPTQAQSSIHALRIVDILPASKNTIIVPEEFTKITGADFDIDHLYLASYNFKKDNNNNLTRKFDEGTKGYYQNKMLSCILTLLRDTENSLHSLYKSIDNDTELITNVSDYIPESGSTKDEPYNFGTLHEQVIRKNDYITGKTGIAPFALNSTGHMLCRQYGVKFRSSILVDNTRLSDFDTVLDKDDNFVSAWLSGFINAHVDIVKDPYISRLNVNPFTYNMLNLMIRCGWGDTALWFLANPLIRSMAEANDLADSQYMRRRSSSKSGKTYREELLYNAVTQYLNEAEISDEVLGSILGSSKKGTERAAIVNWLEQNQDKLLKAAITGEMDHDTALNVFYAWKILEKYSIALSDLIQHTKVETRKYGKNFISVGKYYDEYKQLFYPNDLNEGLWDTESLQSLAENSWINKKTELVYELPQSIFGGQTFNANPRFIKAVMKFADKLQYDGRKLYQDDIVTISRHLQTAIKSQYFADYARNVLKMSDKDIANLFTGYMSMNRQLVSLKDLISNNPDYARLASNPFLNQIYSMLEDKPVFANGRDMADRPGFVTVLDNVDDSKLNSDLLSEGWLNLMHDEDPKVRKFAKKFVVYAFFSSGEFKGWNKMLKYVPYEWIAGQVDPQYLSYSDFIEEKLKNISEDYSDLYDDIVANNFMDYKFASLMEEYDENDQPNFLNSDRGVKIGKGVSFDLVKDVATYISIRKAGMRSGNQDSYDLFKRIGIVKVGKNYHPVYAKIKKRGYHTRGNDVYEYGWNFNYAENERIGSDTFDYDGAIKRVQEYVMSGALDGFSEANIRALNKIYTKPEENQLVAPKPKVIEPGSHIATRGYKKGDPLKHPEFNYIFTENALAYDAIKTGNTSVKINVSDVNGTNLAGIRTDAQGNVTPNAYGIIVKKYQLDNTGKFVAQEGIFQDTEEDFNTFKKLNEEVFNKIEQSPNKINIFPLQMALGRSALPKRFAEWLSAQLLDRFGVVSEVIGHGTNNVITFQMKYSYGNNKRPDVSSTTTFDAVKNGERTATTRYGLDGHISEWSKLKTGDIIPIKSSSGDIAYVRITKPLTKLSEDTNAEEWSKKEGWSVEYFNSTVKPKLNDAYQIEFEYAGESAPSSKYSGYGLSILRVEPKESNINQSRDYDWKYEEDSGYSGVLEELGLPEKVRMNGGMTYRPTYDFGRIYLTESERDFITESVSIGDKDGYAYEKINVNDLNTLLKNIQSIYKSGSRQMISFTEDWENDINNSGSEVVVNKNEYHTMELLYEDILNSQYFDENDYDPDEMKISLNMYNIVNFVKENIELLEQLIKIADIEDNIFDILFLSDDAYSLFEKIQDYSDLVLEYSYSDKRQLELFSDEDFKFDPSFAEHCKH